MKRKKMNHEVAFCVLMIVQGAKYGFWVGEFFASPLVSLIFGRSYEMFFLLCVRK